MRTVAWQQTLLIVLMTGMISGNKRDLERTQSEFHFSLEYARSFLTSIPLYSFLEYADDFRKKTRMAQRFANIRRRDGRKWSFD